MAIQDLYNIETFGYRSPTKDIDTQASLISTQNNFDFSITGTGFFKFYDYEKNRYVYSRNGSFIVDIDGKFVNYDGYILQPEVRIDTNAFNDFLRNNQGTIGEILHKQVFREIKKMFPFDHKISVYKLTNLKVIREGNYFLSNDTILDNNSKVNRGLLELSNVDPLEAILNLERILMKEDEKSIKSNLEYKISLIKELRSRYIEIEHNKDFGKYEAYEAYNQDLKFFYVLKNQYLKQIKFE